MNPGHGPLNHVGPAGESRMVDVSAKPETVRTAVATARVRMQPDTLRAVLQGDLPKGEVLAVARVAAVQAAKRTPDWIPMCHPMRLAGVQVDFTPGEDVLDLRVEVRAVDRTGVEMEALTAAAAAALTVYDMAKSADKGMVIEQVRLESKTGGKSGDWARGQA